MSAPLAERTEIIVIRAWLESDGRMRARVTATDLSLREQESACTAEGAGEIVRLVRDRLERFAEPAR